MMEANTPESFQPSASIIDKQSMQRVQQCSIKHVGMQCVLRAIVLLHFAHILNKVLPLGGGGGVLGPIFVGYVPLVSQNPYPIIVIFYGQL